MRLANRSSGSPAGHGGGLRHGSRGLQPGGARGELCANSILKGRGWHDEAHRRGLDSDYYTNFQKAV
jgi:hypothetical protein